MYQEFAEIYDKFMEEADYDYLLNYLKKLVDFQNINEILDLGCGTGELTKRLLKENFNVIGVDYSEEMLAIASSKINILNVNENLYKQDMKNLNLNKKFDLVICIFDTINHLKSNSELLKTFTSVYNHMKDNSYFIFDVVSREFMDEMFPGGYFVDEREEMTIIWSHDYDEVNDLDYVNTSFFIKLENGNYKKLEEFYEKKIFSNKKIERIAKEVGFKIFKLEENNEFAGNRIFYVLKK